MGTILVVDDHEPQRYAIARMLEHAGHTVMCAHTGEEALATARDHRPDLVLLDINLPDRNGLVVAQTLKADANLGDVPIIFHSATGAPPQGVEAKTAELGAFLTTPIERDHLLSIVSGILARAGRKAG